jgi:RNA polymerase sigma factor (sigma-70 family)
MRTQDDPEAIIAAKQLLPAAGQPIILTGQEAASPPRAPGVPINPREYIGLIRRMAWPFLKKAWKLFYARKQSTRPAYEDFVSAGKIGLMIAVRRYDPSKGANFSTYAYFWIRKYLYRCLDDFRKNSCGMPVELDTKVGEAISNDAVKSDYFTAPPTPGDEPSQREEDLRLALAASLKKRLSALQRKVIRLRYLPDGEKRRLTQREVAGKLGLSTRHIKRIEAEALKRLSKDPALELFMQPEVEDCRRAAVKKNTAPPDESKAFSGVKTWMARNSPMRE